MTLFLVNGLKERTAHPHHSLTHSLMPPTNHQHFKLITHSYNTFTVRTRRISPTEKMMSPIVFLVILLPATLAIKSNSLESGHKLLSNITVMGFVYCDTCSNNTFSKHSYFLQGAKVQISCKFKVSSSSGAEISIDAERMTDRIGFYKLDIPPVDGFECKEGHEIQSFCRANLIKSSSPSCNIPGLRSSTGHVAVKSRDANICFFNLNALNYRPAKINYDQCATKGEVYPTNALNSSLFFWPPFIPFVFPWPHLPPLPFPFPPFPFPLPSWFPFPNSPSTDTPAFPFPLPPISSFFPPCSCYAPPSLTPSAGQPSPPSTLSPTFSSPSSQLQNKHP
ncbi:RNA-binding protein 12-like [Dioscorea cayenensis subsp. rotundata]|uniref:RNA-binding protein 12-like n=1 Tax=Dioscorea cayennensis subsp. rotundata TaxID=55577 RepID=A0AB40CEL0_DIOCR|nr:RNA-binding protein 12-like [Dioscorea cayenensis subsp. rotundata]